jgi:16S rRNA (cytosine967-C5)-methyltransferase
MKLYPNLVKAITEALEEIFTNGAYADITVENTLKKDARWGARDRKFIAGYVYDIVRWYRLYKACLTEKQQETNLYYAIFAVAHSLKGFELPLWEEFATINTIDINEAYQKNIDIHEYAKTHIELSEAIEFFEKKKTPEVKIAEKTEKN